MRAGLTAGSATLVLCEGYCVGVVSGVAGFGGVSFPFRIPVRVPVETTPVVCETVIRTYLSADLLALSALTGWKASQTTTVFGAEVFQDISRYTQLTPRLTALCGLLKLRPRICARIWSRSEELRKIRRLIMGSRRSRFFLSVLTC